MNRSRRKLRELEADLRLDQHGIMCQTLLRQRNRLSGLRLQKLLSRKCMGSFTLLVRTITLFDP